jgi:sugar/nucleoside kinase (ribokinase family)
MVANGIPKVVICGDGCLNVVLQIAEPLKRGMNFDLGSRFCRPGGNALVTALALCRWKMEVSYLGVIGADAEGDGLMEWMSKAGVRTDCVMRRGKTRISYALVDPDERTILDQRQSSGELTAFDWDSTPTMRFRIAEANAVMADRYCSGIHRGIVETIAATSVSNRPALFYRTGSRPSPGAMNESYFLPRADYCLTKASFLSSLGLGQDIQTACQRLSSGFGTPSVVATMGAGGAAYYDKASGAGVVPTQKLAHPATTLGGGDWFRAGFLFGHLRGAAIDECVRLGNASAIIHCSKGESESLTDLFFSADQLEELVRKTHRLVRNFE